MLLNKEINKLTKGSILCSITVLLFAIGKLTNIMDTTSLAISSYIMCLSIIKLGIKYSLLVLISSTITSFILGYIEYSVVYILFFGVYPLIKYLIESLRNILMEFTLKILYFNLITFFVISMYLRLDIPKFAFIPTSLFIIFYDLVLTKLIQNIYDNPLINKL